MHEDTSQEIRTGKQGPAPKTLTTSMIVFILIGIVLVGIYFFTRSGENDVREIVPGANIKGLSPGDELENFAPKIER